jgi:outer membrane murein-binding lipoprotein Lpp
MSAGPQPRTAAANAARRAATEAKVQRVRDGIVQLRRRKQPITYPAVALTATVSRTFLYENPDARALVTGAIAAGTGQRAHAAAHDAQEASWRERALNTEAALKAAHAEIRAQRDRIATLMGQARDAESEWTPQAIGQITTENTTLKQRVRQLTQDNRALQERLQAARSNVRFADRRMAQLEAQLLDHPPATAPRAET